MSVTATAVIASAFIGAEKADAASHKVKSGDTLWSISQKYDTNVSQIQSWNNLKNDIIFPNQVLEVGDGGAASTVKKPAPEKADKPKEEKQEDKTEVSKDTTNKNESTKKPAATATRTYTVKSGDTLGAIAYDHGISLNDLMAWNNLESTLIFPGDKFVVSKGAPKPDQNVSAPPAPTEEVEKPVEAKPDKPAEKPAKPVEDKPVVEKPDKKPAESKPEASKPVASGLIETAKSVIGSPYVWAGQTPKGFDCSGFIHWSLTNSGTNMARQSTEGYYNRSYIVNKPAVGDFVFFENTYKKGISHMGIYVGDNKFIHASTSQGVTITDLSNPYWSERFHSYKKLY